MKWLILALFIAAFMSSMFWFESGERNYTPTHKTALAIAALGGWALVLVLGTVML